MSEIKDGGAAFPLTGTQWNPDRDAYEVSPVSDGMSLRDYFAAKAMAGIVANPDTWGESTHDGLSVRAYAIADAMLRARSQS